MRATLFFVCVIAVGQLPSTGEPRLDQLRMQMAQNLARLPNYTCLMTVDRSVKPAGRNTFMTHQDTLRLEIAEVGNNELVGWPGSKLGEQSIEDMPPGLFASGDFSGVANVVFRSAAPHIELVGDKRLHGRDAVEYVFRVDRAVSNYQIIQAGAKEIVGYHGHFWADAQSLELLRLEFVMEDLPPVLRMRRATTIIDYQKSHIGDGDFLLPLKVERTVENVDVSVSHNISTFSACKQYGTETVLKFDGQEVPQTPEAQQPVREVRLPSGVRLPIKIETAMDAKKSATGDAVVARTTAEVRNGDTVIPAGSEVRGHISDLRRTNSVLLMLQLDFTEIHAPGLLVKFDGFLEEAEKRKGVRVTNSITIPGSLYVDDGHLNLAGMKLVYRTLNSK